jgi:drug/metabolite transporter (DMT)-like permease
MRGVHVIGLTALTMICFAANSVLCRLALADPLIDPASFTAIRLVSGAIVLGALVTLRAGGPTRNLTAGDWKSAFALFTYAAAFSYAYVSLDASVGALILFGVVQATMIGYGLVRGERLGLVQTLGALLAAGGLFYLMLPGLSAPPLAGAALMALAGAAWGVYSLLGRTAKRQTFDTTSVTAGNFIRAAPMGLLLLPLAPQLDLSASGVALAIASGALASGGGYAIWYAALKGLNASEAAIVQLTVPVIAAAGGVLFIQEALTLRFFLAAAAILGGVAVVLTARNAAART